MLNKAIEPPPNMDPLDGTAEPAGGNEERPFTRRGPRAATGNGTPLCVGPSSNIRRFQNAINDT